MIKKVIFGVFLVCGLLSLVLWRSDEIPPKPLPLLAYTIPNLRQRQIHTSQIVIEKKIADYPDYSSYLFAFHTLGKKMTGQINIPTQTASDSAWPVIILVRGYIPAESYQTGAGTKAAAAVFAKHRYVTLAPDFLGFGGSDAEDNNSWVARFQKPLNVAELIKTVTDQPTIATATDSAQITLNPQRLGIWAHSNGGQIALTTLEILPQSIPTTLWAPVTAPFPYSILFFSDEDVDEGKAGRQWIADFEKDYDARQFSLTDFLQFIKSPLQIHQGLQDEAIHYVWSEEFVDKMKKESEESVTFYSYPGANHNLQPVWNTVIQRDLDFFARHLR